MDEEELRKQREEVTAIVKMRVAGAASGTQVKDGAWGKGLRPATCTRSQDLQLSPVSPQNAGDFICTVYLEEKKAETEQHVKVGARDLEATGSEESGWARRGLTWLEEQGFHPKGNPSLGPVSGWCQACLFPSFAPSSSETPPPLRDTPCIPGLQRTLRGVGLAPGPHSKAVAE